MNLKILSPKQSLNKAYLKEKISRTDIELFKVHFTALTDKINDKGDEEHLKSLIADFLKLTWYNTSQHQINPIGKNDLVIHTGKSPADPYGVILEVKRPANTGEMISEGKANVKAFHELVLYYLDERITHNRNELKQLIVTNIYHWYIIDANEFDKKIYRNTAIKKLYDLKKSDNKDNPWFYDELRKLFDNHADLTIDATFFDLREYKKIIANASRQDDKGLIPLYKILSPVHLLKLPFANDSNTLQPKFYSELLHLIGLYEYKEGSKKLISRKKDDERNPGSLLENTIAQLERHDKISRVEKPSQYGDTYEQRLYAVALELVITWINRILFLKLLEAQLINYHKGDKGDREYTFLTKEKIKDFDDLDQLFFSVLAKRASERTVAIQKLFGKVPYLNSSLFEPTELEQQTFFINSLENDAALPFISATVLKDANGKTLKGALDTLDYLFAFLNAYDFSSEGAEAIQEDNKQLINASVLGLIFEKINGYKDGSFFTPGFITMYMCRETIRRAVVQKFNEAKGWDCKEYSALFDRVKDKKEANNIINSLKICDPAVGSGHFLVSALNEMIAIKSDLRVLTDREGRGMHHYGIEVVNDELIITDEDGDIFEYNPNSKESQRVQETLFHEKQTIIENCLFGVDINPNSVKICRLRLWIELLKNAYYKADTQELETLPNIDINIKVGNSLISRFGLDADLKQALRKSNYGIETYRAAVQQYRESKSKEEKREMERLINVIKNDFRTEISTNDPKVKLLDKKGNELYNKYNTDKLFIEKPTMAQIKDRKKLEDEVNKLSAIIANIKNNKVYENAFEWRFEFPEVLNDDGDFLGFDVIIGNPPYINALDLKKILTQSEFDFYKSNFKTAKGTVDIYVYFFELAVNLTRNLQFITYITPNRYLSASYGFGLRSHLLELVKYISVGDYSNVKVFKEASTYPIVTFLKKEKTINNYKFSSYTYINEIEEYKWREFDSSTLKYLNEFIWGFILSDKFNLTKKIIDQSVPLSAAGIINATSTAGEADTYHNFINQTGGFKLINTGTIDKYATTWGYEKLIDKGAKFLTPFLPFDKELLSKNRYELYSKPKLIVAKIAISAEVFFDINGEYASINTNCLHTFKKGFNPYYILGWLNSKLFQYTYKCFFEGLKMAGGYMLYSAPNLSNMYIKEANELEQKLIIDTVLKITTLKNHDHHSDTSILENKIDQLVYQLYSLTEEEIKIVEGKND